MIMVSSDNGRVHETVALTPSLTADIVAGLIALAVLLRDRHYPLRARGKILDYVAREGTLEGCGLLHPKHAITAESTFVDGMTAVPADDPSWGSPIGREFFGNIRDDVFNPSDAVRLDVDTEFESWLASLDAAGLSPMPDFDTAA